MKIFIDFDGVIFNSAEFRKFLREAFVKNGVSAVDFDKTLNCFSMAKNRRMLVYSPQKQIKILSKIKKINSEKIEKSVRILCGSLKKFIFPDALYFLKNFKTDNLFILSFGDRTFQMEKIKNSKIDKFFGKIIVSTENKLNLILKTAKKYNFKKGENVIFIDDCPDNLKRVGRIKKSIKTFYVKRQSGSYGHLSCPDADYEVKNMKEALKIIKKF